MTAKFGEPQATSVDPLRIRVRAQLDTVTNGTARLGCMILDGDTGALIDDDGRADLPAGGRGRAEIIVTLPEDSGKYRAVISPVEENVAWFHQRGSDALLMDAEVANGEARVVHLERSTGASRTRERVARAIRRGALDPFRTVWRNRALIVSMVRRDIHGRYRGSVAGLFWAVINPLLMMLTYFLVFGVILKVRFGPTPEQQSVTNFPLYFIAGMLPWLAFSEALGRSAGIVLEHRMLVKRVVFPIEILPVNLTVAGLVSEFFGLIVFLTTLLAIRHTVPATVIYLPLILVPQILITLGLCWFVAAIGVFLRDVGQFLAFFLTLLFFATPICYPETGAPGMAKRMFAVNPIYVLVRAYRAVLLEGTSPDWNSLLWLGAAGLLAFIFGYAWFYKSRKAFADVL